MSLTPVEIIISARDKANPQATKRFDVLAIQPSGTKWGLGSLTGNLMFCVELDLPCGVDFMVKKRCSGCEHLGIEWEVFPPTLGTIGHPKTSCPVQKYMVADISHELAFDIHSFPYIINDLKHKHGSLLNYSLLLSPGSISIVESEEPSISFISEETKDERVALAKANPVNSSNLVRKSGS